MEAIISFPGKVARAALMLSSMIFLYFLRWHLDGFWSWVEEKYWLPTNQPAQDGKPVMDGVDEIVQERYGSHHLEKLHILNPQSPRCECTHDDEDDDLQDCDHDSVILYAHGGGFIAANSSCLLHSVTTFCRDGWKVYSIDYPLAPNDPFPCALVSVLRAMQYLKEQKKINKIHLLGDSAGGGLVTMAAAYVCNPVLLNDLSDLVDEPLYSWNFPEITTVVTLYGFLDQKSWISNTIQSITAFELELYRNALKFCMWCYSSNGHLDNNVSIMDIVDEVEAFPRSLLIGGHRDLLVLSTLSVYNAFKMKGFDTHLKIYEGRHGFFGWPAAWTNGGYVKNALPACAMINAFFNDGKKMKTGGGCTHDPHEDKLCCDVNDECASAWKHMENELKILS